MLTQILMLALWTGAGMMTGGAVLLACALVTVCVASALGWQVSPWE